MARAFLPSLLLRFEHTVVLAAYTLIALVMSFPLVAQFGDHIAGVDGDVWSYLWAMGWARVSLLNLATNPFHSDYIYYPLGGATQLLWGTALPSFASIPLQLAFGLVPAFNLTYLASSALTGYGTYLLGKQILSQIRFSGKSPSIILLSSFVLGLVFTFGALRMGYGIAFTNLFHTEFIPFYVLFLLRATRVPGWKNAILAGLFFALNVYVDFQIAAFLAVLTVFWCLYILGPLLVRELGKYFLARDALRVRDETISTSAGSILSGLLPRWLTIGGIAAILSLPMLLFVLQDFGIEGGDYIRVYPLRYSADRSYDLLSYILPNARSTFYQSFEPRINGVNASVNVEGDSELSPDRQSFLGITILVLALIGAIKFSRRLLFWIFVTLLFAVLSLGPILHVAGMSTNIPLPFGLINNVPILNHIRIPMRYGVLVFLGAAVLAGAGSLTLFSKNGWLVVPVSGMILLEAAILPFPTLEYQVPAVYQQIAQAPGDFTVLEIPSFNWRFAAKNETYQATHQKRILRAYTNRIAPDVADYFNLRQTPLVVRSIRILEGAEQGVLTKDEIAEDRAALDDTLNFFGIRYAVLHRDQLDTAHANQLNSYLRDVMKATVFYQDDEVTGYQFTASPKNGATLDLDLADDSSLMYLGRGWQTEPLANVAGERGRFLRGESSEIYFDQGVEPYTGMTLDTYLDASPQTFPVRWNDIPLGSLMVKSGWQTGSIVLPSADWSRPMNRLILQHSTSSNQIAIGSVDLK